MIAIFGFAAGFVCGVGIGLAAAQIWAKPKIVYRDKPAADDDLSDAIRRMQTAIVEATLARAGYHRNKR